MPTGQSDGNGRMEYFVLSDRRDIFISLQCLACLLFKNTVEIICLIVNQIHWKAILVNLFIYTYNSNLICLNNFSNTNYIQTFSIISLHTKISYLSDNPLVKILGKCYSSCFSSCSYHDNVTQLQVVTICCESIELSQA